MKMWMWMILGGVGTAVTGLIVANKASASKNYVGGSVGLPPGLIQPPGITLTTDDVAFLNEVAARNPTDYLTLDGGLQLFVNLYARYLTDFNGFVSYMAAQGYTSTTDNPGPSQPWAQVARGMSLRQFGTKMNH